MITTEGKNHIRRYLAQYTPSIAQSVAFGIGATAESLADTSLALEVVRSPINLITYDFATNKLVYKASIPDDYVGKVYEVGLYSLDVDPAAGGFGSRIITTFDSVTESWVDPTDGTTPAAYTAVATRVGANSLSLTPLTSATMTETLRSLTLDLSGNSASDSIIVALNVGNANTDSVTIKFMTDAANYYSYTLGTTVSTAGYKVASFAKGSAVVTGTPDWGNITEIQVSATSAGTGASDIEMDAIRVEDRDTGNLDYVLVARKVLASPVTKVDGQALDLEFTLDITL